jgi:hypothetical protein
MSKWSCLFLGLVVATTATAYVTIDYLLSRRRDKKNQFDQEEYNYQLDQMRNYARKNDEAMQILGHKIHMTITRYVSCLEIQYLSLSKIPQIRPDFHYFDITHKNQPIYFLTSWISLSQKSFDTNNFTDQIWSTIHIPGLCDSNKDLGSIFDPLYSYLVSHLYQEQIVLNVDQQILHLKPILHIRRYKCQNDQRVISDISIDGGYETLEEFISSIDETKLYQLTIFVHSFIYRIIDGILVGSVRLVCNSIKTQTPLEDEPQTPLEVEPQTPLEDEPQISLEARQDAFVDASIELTNNQC